MISAKKNALNAVAAKQGREEGEHRNPTIQEGVTMTSSLPSMPQHFDTSISVAGITIAPNELIGGGEPAETVVTINTRDELLTFTPSQACAVAAALQAVAVHVMEQTGTEGVAA